MADPDGEARLSRRDKLVAAVLATVLALIIFGIFRLGIGYLYG